MNTFPKKEHLYGEKVIENLHTTGSSFLVYPLRVVYLNVSQPDEQIPVRVMIGVSKKKFKKAVDRNRAKRLMREAYRLNKSSLVSIIKKEEVKIYLSFQYIADEMLTFDEISTKMQKALDRLTKIIAEKSYINR
ncbi:MAG: ribonuclease P protein component [Paludibacteraceae bacterium]|nr:ribonuclease P protein component [Paludibacteraceae bacterium]